MKRAFFLAAAAALALESYAQTTCNFNLTIDPVHRDRIYDVSWLPVSGATGYTVEEIRPYETTNSHQVVRRVAVSLNDIRNGKFTHRTGIRATVPVTAEYRITALQNGAPMCSTTFNLEYKADAALQLATQKSVIPLVGNGPGAHGSQFKTFLRLRSTQPNQRGRLVFHPANVPARDSDPSIPYQFTSSGEIREFDDIVAAFGMTGIGTIDIIPERTSASLTVPFAEARLYNVSAAGTFGTIESQTQAHEFLEEQTSGRITSLITFVPEPDLRINLGVRTFQASQVFFALRRNGTLIHQVVEELFPDNLLFLSAQALFGTNDIRQGDQITISIPNGAAVPMYSLTDNRTNDPALFVPPSRVLTNLENYYVQP